MMRSLFSGVAGLKSHQTRMDSIGNNIANVNTTGYKSSRVTFADTLYQTTAGAASPTGTTGGTNPKQIGLGTAVASIDTIFTDGSTQSTGKNTDLAITGSGLFVVKDGSGTYYTRDGAFEFDAAGNYVLPGNGMHVQGWMGTNGVVSTNGATTNIVVQSGKSMAAKATATATYTNNLNSSALTISSISSTSTTSTSGDTVTADDATEVTLTLADGTTQTGTSGTAYTVGATLGSSTIASITSSSPRTTSTTNDTATASATINVKLTLSDGSTVTGTSGTKYTVGGTYGTGTLTIKSLTASPVSATASTSKPVTLTMSDGTTVTETSGTYTLDYSLPVTTTITAYDSLGVAHSIPVYFTKTKTDSTNGNQWTVSLDSDTTKSTSSITEADGSKTTLDMASSTLQFSTDGKYTSGSGTMKLTLTNGSTGSQTVTLNLTALTQYSGTSTIAGTTDGNAAGTLKSVSIDSSGVITGTYTNGVKQSEAQVAIAQFNNPGGLTKNGASLYTQSNNSGTANVKTASDLGVTLTPSALEMSNVDIANEFSDMIITQRGFQSNSKIITVGDEMLDTLINMKR